MVPLFVVGVMATLKQLEVRYIKLAGSQVGCRLAKIRAFMGCPSKLRSWTISAGSKAAAYFQVLAAAQVRGQSPPVECTHLVASRQKVPGHAGTDWPGFANRSGRTKVSFHAHASSGSMANIYSYDGVVHLNYNACIVVNLHPIARSAIGHSSNLEDPLNVKSALKHLDLLFLLLLAIHLKSTKKGSGLRCMYSASISVIYNQKECTFKQLADACSLR